MNKSGLRWYTDLDAERSNPIHVYAAKQLMHAVARACMAWPAGEVHRERATPQSSRRHHLVSHEASTDPRSSVIFVLTYFLVLVLVAVFEIFFSFSFVLVFIIFSF